jgi:hypothetical protein
MSSNNCIIPECYVDSCLVEVLLNADRKNYANHTKGNGTVARKMIKEFGDSFCVGIIDEDRRQLDYLSNFNVVSEIESLKLWRHSDLKKHHYIIQVRPVIEKWILALCGSAGISLKEFKLPSSLEELKKISKSVGSREDSRFVELFKRMKKEENSSIMRMKYWLEYLNENKYKVDINQLKNG